MTFFQRHWPTTWTEWKKYLRVFLPIVAGSTLFALNGVVDNFMVGHLNQGASALGAINSWTNILTGWFLGTAAAGSVIMAQFYHAKKFKVVQEIARYRFYLCLGMAILFAIVAWSAPDILSKTFVNSKGLQHIDLSAWTLDKLKNHPGNLGTNEIAYVATMLRARIYARVIAVQWILISLSFNYGNQLRELGYGKFTMMWGMGTLTANVALNSILMYGFGMDVDGAAWASVAGRIVAISSGILVIRLKKIKIGFNPFTLFQVSMATRKLFWKRWVYFMSIFTGTFFVTFRNFFYSQGFPAGTAHGNIGLGIGVSGLLVLGLTSALMNIFTTTFSALASMSSNFVGSELGKGNVEQAKKNSDKLKGFNTTMAACLGLIAIAFAFAIPYMSFLSESKYQPGHEGDYNFIITDAGAQLRQVKYGIMTIGVFYPIWIWFSTSYRNGNAGGKGGKFAFVDWFVSGPVQMGWLAILMLVIVPSTPWMQHDFWIPYVFFFLSDFLKMIGQEILYYRYDWLHVLTHEEADDKKASAKKYMNENMKTP